MNLSMVKMNSSPSSGWPWRIAVAVTAVAQVAVAAWAGAEVGTTARENGSAILPAGWAFSIWGLIYLLCLLCAVVLLTSPQARRATLRAAGPPLAVALLGDCLWVLLFPREQFLLAQLVILLGAAAGVLAALRLQRLAGRDGALVRGLVATTVGLLAGWLTAAAFVGLAATLTALGAPESGTAAQLIGVVLLLVAAGVAAAVLVRGGTGPPLGSLAYGAAVVWGLAGVAAEQWGSQQATALTALVLAVALTALALTRTLRARARRPAPHTVVL